MKLLLTFIILTTGLSVQAGDLRSGVLVCHYTNDSIIKLEDFNGKEQNILTISGERGRSLVAPFLDGMDVDEVESIQVKLKFGKIESAGAIGIKSYNSVIPSRFNNLDVNFKNGHKLRLTIRTGEVSLYRNIYYNSTFRGSVLLLGYNGKYSLNEFRFENLEGCSY